MSKTLRRTCALAFAILIGMGARAQTQPSAQVNASPTSSDPNGVKYFSKDDLAASFSKGGTIATESNYRVMTAHRTESGSVEIHRSYTDVMYIVQGSTNIVTGGKVIGEKDTNPDEPRGDSIDGGETRHLSAGDSIIIPVGVPHWMKDVQGELRYLVVKVRKP